MRERRLLGFVRPPTFTGWVKRQESMTEADERQRNIRKNERQKILGRKVYHQSEMQQI